MKKNIIFITIIILIIVVVLLGSRQGSNRTKPAPSSLPEIPRIVSTKPDPLDETIVSSTETIELTFSRPLENVPEFKIRIEPKTDYRVELSGDRKTAKIIPVSPYELGTTYTLFIMADSKFEGGARLVREEVFHFRTIKYRGF
ncbi:Ig-like domain-containing protein [Candidatus Daviesbacteria bacterium]|nr:Ig-like domain-containing protein [Candidatus Daviesbacteria bacterium]